MSYIVYFLLPVVDIAKYCDRPEHQQRGAELDTMSRKLDYDDAKKRRTITITMLLLEDIPELCIDLLFIYLYTKNIEDFTLFAVSMVLTAIHMLRMGVDLHFQWKNISHIPRILIVEHKGNVQQQLDGVNPSVCTHIFAFNVDLSQKRLQMFLQKQRKSLQSCV